MLKIKSPAKINLTLEVLKERPDGYHQIRSVMQTVDLCDEILIEETPTPGAIQIHTDSIQCPVDERNLVWQALWWLRKATGFDRGLSIQITKNIPIGAGLGGGSSNAASVLAAVIHHFGIQIDQERLVAIAAQVGSDVPFFLIGGTALATGRGERVRPTNPIPKTHFLLLNPGFPVDTAKVYRSEKLKEWLGARPAGSNASARFLSAIEEGEPWRFIVNELEPAARACYPRIGEAFDLLAAMAVPYAVMTGSGPTVVAPIADRKTALQLENRARIAGFWAQTCVPVDGEAFGRLVRGEGEGLSSPGRQH